MYRTAARLQCQCTRLVYGTRRTITSKVTADLDQTVQSYVSTSRDPLLNLSIEHHLLQKTSSDSVILFLYVNRPCVVIGRNQNPWVEVNLAFLKEANERARAEQQNGTLPEVTLVRRRSGGGTVFHDEGNVNWTVICPSPIFTRDKHAEMVVRALRNAGHGRSRVNERHDIVLDQGVNAKDRTWGPEDDLHATPWQSPGAPRSRKISGSAYKLTRGRALHHGTCLLSSPNLKAIPDFLHSPAKPFITARGVESVSSPVANVGMSNDDFIAGVQKQFKRMYTDSPDHVTQVDEGWLEDGNIRKGYDELKSSDWMWTQTPRFSISNLPSDVSKQPDGQPFVNLQAREGAITDTDITLSDLPDDFEHKLGEVLAGQKIHEIQDWRALFNRAGLGTTQSYAFADWLQEMLPAHDYIA